MNITAVVVLYQLLPDQSPTIASLVRSYARIRGNGPGLKLLVYDNSPRPQTLNLSLSFEHRYVHDSLNGGLAAAYNCALDSDPGGESQWLLLLDQDSTLPDDFLEEVFKALNLIGMDEGVAAVVPKILQRDRPISPALVKGGRVRPLKAPPAGISRENLTAINSGALGRKTFLAEIGGFNRQFRLDYLDHWLFSEIGRRGKKVYVTGAVVVHDLSVGNEGPVSAGRYLSILRSETLFYREYAGPGNFPCHLGNLVWRSTRQLLKGRWKLFLATARHLLRALANQNP
jgi:GT2 family glycosyltransferase